MNPIWAFIKTTRPLNLLIIAVTMLCMRVFVEGGFLNHLTPNSTFPGLNISIHQISWFNFSLLTAIMVFLAASGNIINDYFDVKVDRINKPKRITIDKGLKRRVAMVAHHSLNIFAVLLGFFVAWQEKELFYAIVPVFIASGLWFYSFYLKKTFLLGNILVALVVSVVPIWATYAKISNPIIFSEVDQWTRIVTELQSFMFLVIEFYVIQAYVITLFREVAKDAEDISGDSEFGYRTLPIVWGLRKTRNILLSAMFIWLVVLFWIMYQIMTKNIPIQSFVFFGLVIVPFVIALLSIARRETKKAHFTRASLWLKVTLAGGIIFSFFIPQLMSYIKY